MLLVDFTIDISIWIKITQKALWQITEVDTVLSDSHPTKLRLAKSFEKSLHVLHSIVFTRDGSVHNDPQPLGYNDLHWSRRSMFSECLFRNLDSCSMTIL